MLTMHRKSFIHLFALPSCQRLQEQGFIDIHAPQAYSILGTAGRFSKYQMSECMLGKGPTGWISLGPGLWVFWKHGTLIGWDPARRAKEAWLMLEPEPLPDTPAQEEWDSVNVPDQETQAHHPYPGPCLEWHPASYQLWNGYV